MAKPKAKCKTPASQPANVPETTFDFFGLPRELRDEIYDRCTLKIRREHRFNTGLQADTVNASLRSVSRLFKAEYDDRCRRFENTLTVSASDAVATGLRLPRTVSSRITHMNVKLCVTYDVSIQQHALWFSRYVKKFPRLRTIFVELHSDMHVDEVTPDDVRDFISVRQTVALKSSYHGGHHFRHMDFASQSNRLIWDWTRAGGTKRY